MRRVGLGGEKYRRPQQGGGARRDQTIKSKRIHTRWVSSISANRISGKMRAWKWLCGYRGVGPVQNYLSRLIVKSAYLVCPQTLRLTNPPNPPPGPLPNSQPSPAFFLTPNLPLSPRDYTHPLYAPPT